MPSPDTACVRAPASKSISHRYCIGAALAHGTSELHHVLGSRDLECTRAILCAAGARMEALPGEEGGWRVTGMDGRPRGGTDTPLSCDVHESGTTCRLLTAVLAAGHGLFRIHGAPRMHERPIDELTRALEALGTEVRFEQRPDCPPLLLRAAGLDPARNGGRVRLGMDASSQYFSGLLLAAPLAPAPLCVELGGQKAVSWPYVGLTLHCLEDFGIRFSVETREPDGPWQLLPDGGWRALRTARPDGLRITVQPGTYRAGSYQVEGDWSGASYLLAAGALGSRPVRVDGLRADSLQGDRAMLDILRAMGARAEVEGYGGMLMSTWFDRPLSVAGRLLVRTADGVESRLVHPERALACIPNLCIHFNREANTGLNYNPQVDLQPIFGAEGGSLKDTLAAEAGGKAEDILATDLVLCITEKAQRVGLQGEYFMSGRIDDLECAYATLYGFLQGRGEEAGRGDIWVMFDNEEVGSSSRQGAQGSLMSDVLARIEESLGVTKEQSIRARTNCLLLSADNGHAIHPNHPEKSDQKLPVNMGGGVILKYNARQTYTTSGLTGAAFTAICEKAGVPVQTFANRADVAGGSTLGNLLGRQILMPMVDIGVGQLAMHSAMETASCKDAEYLANACAAYYNTPIFQPEDGQWKLGL